MKPVWISCGGDFELGDVVRWHEEIPRDSQRRKLRKGMRFGRWFVTAQIGACWRDGMASLIALKCEITQNAYGMELIPLAKGAPMKRKRSTLAKAGAEKRVEPDPPKPAVKSRFLS
jgi:hypothetical protein